MFTLCFRNTVYYFPRDVLGIRHGSLQLIVNDYSHFDLLNTLIFCLKMSIKMVVFGLQSIRNDSNRYYSQFFNVLFINLAKC